MKLAYQLLTAYTGLPAFPVQTPVKYPNWVFTRHVKHSLGALDFQSTKVSAERKRHGKV